MKNTNLNPLFIDQIRNFGHLITTKTQTKNDFLKQISTTYDINNPKTHLFYLATERSEFDTIRLNREKTTILFNQ